MSITKPAIAIGALVRARNREWVVLPETTPDLWMLRPLGGSDDEIVGIHQRLETVFPAQFDLPTPNALGDHTSCRLLRDAVRLSLRASAGPFRSFARISVEPRPYQLVPLLMALKQETVRLLIADDVGIGKTIEAGLVARELLDRGEAKRFAVLCPPQLAEQWQVELRNKFHLEAELVLSSTITSLERHLRMGESVFEHYPFVVVSTDFIKSERRRDDFLRTCPEMVIVDEAHTCAHAGSATGSGRHQRFQLLKGLAQNTQRHMVLVTATPHSGNEEAFRSLLTLLNPAFADLPADLSGRENENQRRKLAAHFVQRKRGDIARYLDTDTPFPQRKEAEQTYRLSNDYRAFFEAVIEFARESVSDKSGSQHQQRIRWWSALALLRAIGSSPVAAAATLRNRAATVATTQADEADAIGRRTVFDHSDDDSAEDADMTPGSDIELEDGTSAPNTASAYRRKLQALARQADGLSGESKDAKLKLVIETIKTWVERGFKPIVFCRFIQTAEYVAAALKDKLRGVTVAAVTGILPPSEREQRVLELAQADKRVLVATDCLSEGINLQHAFDAVLHYDLAWNPTRHEQREGRIDRYGQQRKEVQTLLFYGQDNPIDGLVLDVLIRKHKTIRSSLGISVPVPIEGDELVEALMEGLLLRGPQKNSDKNREQMILGGFEDVLAPKRTAYEQAFAQNEARARRSRSMFAQESIKVDDLARELNEARAAIGEASNVRHFVSNATHALGGTAKPAANQAPLLQLDWSSTMQALRDMLGETLRVNARFELPVQDHEVYLSRTHPLVETLANYVLETALDPQSTPNAPPAGRRCGVIRTDAVSKRSTLLLLRLRHHILERQRDGSMTPLLAEETLLAAFAGAPQHAEWLSDAQAEGLLKAEARANVAPDVARATVQDMIAAIPNLMPHLQTLAQQRAQALAQAHARVREAANLRRSPPKVEPQWPLDVLGVYVFLPAPSQR